MIENLSDMMTDKQARALNTHATQLIDLFEDAEFYEKQFLDIEFIENHVRSFDQESLIAVHRVIKKRRRIGDCPVESFLSACPNPRSELYYELWLTKSRALYLYKRYINRSGFSGLLFRMLDSVRLIIMRDEVIHLKKHLYLNRGIDNELFNIKQSERECGNSDDDLSYLRKILPYRLMLEHDAVDRIENPRPSFRKKKITGNKKTKHKKSKNTSVKPVSISNKTKGKKRARRLKKNRTGAHGRLQHLEKKSKSLTTNASIPSDMAVQELIRKLLKAPPIDKRSAYTAIAYVLIYGTTLRKLFEAQSKKFISISVNPADHSATTRCKLKAHPEDGLKNIFNSSTNKNGVTIKSVLLKKMDSIWGLCDFLSHEISCINHEVGLVLKSVRRRGYHVTLNGLARYRASWLANRNIDYAITSLLSGESNPDAAGVNYHLISSQQLQQTQDRFEQYLGHGIGGMNLTVDHKVQFENVGSAVVLLDAKIPAIFNWLCARLESHRYSDLEEYHNLLTLFTDQLLRLSSGYRSVNHPWWRLENFDLETGIMHISDKDSTHSITGRIIVLPEICRSYLFAYQNYLHQSLYVSSYSSALRNHRDLIFENKRPVFFYIINGCPSSVRPKLNQVFMEKLAKLPPNWHRHFMRTALRRCGISGDLVDLWMGHDIAGSDPLHEFSGLSMSDLRNISSVINNILEEEINIPKTTSIFG